MIQIELERVQWFWAGDGVSILQGSGNEWVVRVRRQSDDDERGIGKHANQITCCKKRKVKMSSSWRVWKKKQESFII